MMVAGLVASKPRLNPGLDIGGSSPTHPAHFAPTGIGTPVELASELFSRSILEEARRAGRSAMCGTAVPNN